ARPGQPPAVGAESDHTLPRQVEGLAGRRTAARGGHGVRVAGGQVPDADEHVEADGKDAPAVGGEGGLLHRLAVRQARAGPAAPPQTRAVPSRPAVSTHRPWGLNAARVTPPRKDEAGVTSWPVGRSHPLGTLSRPMVTARGRLPRGLNPPGVSWSRSG